MKHYTSVESADAAPTQPQYKVFEGLRGRLDDQLAKWKQLAAEALPALNELMRREGVPALNLATGTTLPENAANQQ